MTSILIAEEICELDTFTLEQKIQEIQALPDCSSYVEILKLAKLELIDRLQIQDFGRRLANDEIQIQEDIKLPLISFPKINTTRYMYFLKNKKQFLLKMQQNIISSCSYVTIGKPPINYHFKPKTKKVEILQKPKITSQVKNKQFFKLNEKSKKNIIKTINNKQLVESKTLQIRKEDNIQKKQKILQLSLMDKLKQEVKTMNIAYYQNDAYDDMKQIKMSPQKLIQEANLIEEYQHSNQDPYSKQDSINTNYVQTKTILIPSEEGKYLNKQKYQKQDLHLKENVNNIYINFQYNKIQSLDNYKIKDGNINGIQQIEIYQFRENLHKKVNDVILFQKNQPQIIDQEKEKKDKQALIINFNFNFDQISIKKQKNPQNFTKQFKSKSVKVFIKQRNNLEKKKQPLQSYALVYPYKNINSAKESLINNISKQALFKLNYNSEMDKIMNLSSNNFKYNRNYITNNNVYFPYHEFIPSFNKLFPHSKNILNTLRSIEEELKAHFTKGVFDKSKANDYLRLNQNQITFNVISQSDQARKNYQIFNIDLQSFYSRGKIMLQRLNNQIVIEDECQMLLYRVIRTKQDVYNIISSSFHRTENWYELPHGLELKTSWNLLWTWSKPQIDFSDLFYFQKVNHFIENKQIARKDLLKKNIEKIQKLSIKMKSYFDIIPETFLLPGQNTQFIKKFREYSMKDSYNYWILKPVGLSRGRGISLINKIEDIVFSEPIVLQKYVMNPLLIKGYKFDMRIYVLVTSMNPLQVFLYREGFARMSTELYSINQQQIGNKFIHLTNYAIQKENMHYKKNTFEEKIGGSKISLKMLSQKLKDMNIKWQNIEKQIQQIILKSLIACMNVIPQNPNCFQLFGYDIFIDDKQKCWLLEVNSSPSLEKDYILDQIIKQQLVDDIVEIVNPIKYDRSRLLEVVERRRKENEGLKSHINTSNNSVVQLNEDLHYILHGQKFRKYGQASPHNNFKMIAPSEKYHQIVKVIQQYKIEPIIKSQN